MGEKLKIALVDDHEMFRSGLKLMLEKHNEWDVVIEAVSSKDFINQLHNHIPDLVLLNISTYKTDNYENSKFVLEKYPDIKIIVLSMLGDDDYYDKMIEIGVKGFILKSSGVNNLIDAIEEVSIGNNYIAQERLKKIASLRKKEAKKKPLLTKKECDILYLICKGFKNNEISERVFLSVKSIERYRSNLLLKTDSRNTANLVMKTVLNKLIEL